MSIEPTQLKPCPFCGGDKVHTFQHFWWVAHCPKCRAEVPSDQSNDTQAEAIAAWNTRYSAPAGEVEPVAWMYSSPYGKEVCKFRYARDEGRIPDDWVGWTETPLYTHPAPPADLVELVEALRESEKALESARVFILSETGCRNPYRDVVLTQARAVLAKHTPAQGEGG